MVEATEIQYIQSIRKYQLHLPEAIIEAYGLHDAFGKPISIMHENKMELEWLAQKINTQFNAENDAQKTFRNKLNRKKRIALVTLSLCVLSILFSHPISNLLRANQMMVSAVGCTIGIIALLQWLKYVAQGLAGPASKFRDAQETDQIKETILRNFVS